MGGAPIVTGLLAGLLSWALLTSMTRLCADPVMSAPPLALTLADARAIALRQNTDFRISQAQVEAALAQLRVAREWPNPTLDLSTAKISTDGTPEGTPLGNQLYNRAYDSIASLSQLFQVAKRGLLRDAATAGVHAAQFQRDDARRLLLQAVTQEYAAALAARAQADVLAESAAKLRREADIATHRFQAGDLSASDRTRLEIAAEQDELGAEAQRATATTAVVALETLLGQPKPAGTTQLADTLESLLRETPPDLAAAPVGDRPDVAAATASVEQAEANVTLQRRQRVPDLTVSVQYERNPPGQTNTVGFGVSLPLPIWNRYTGEILAAQAARAQAEAQLDKVRIQVSSDVAAARVAYREAAARAERYRTSLVPKSREATRSVSYAYDKGGAALVDLLEAERSDNAIRVAAVQADADSAATGIALLSALGRLPAAGGTGDGSAR
jgi:cobalt-zinc-cadmium efflux system outer membrane protein